MPVGASVTETGEADGAGIAVGSGVTGGGNVADGLLS
jgi:hypothetical protein